MTFSEKQYYEIMKPMLSRALLAMGVNHHFLGAAAHGPKSHQGFAILNLFTKQLISHVLTMIQFGSQPEDPTGHLLKAHFEAFCLEA